MLWLAPWASKTDSRRGIDDRRKSRKPGKHESVNDLPSIKKLRRSVSGLKWLGRLLRNDEARKSARKVREELDGLISLVDDFYHLLGDRNWVFSDELNLERTRARRQAHARGSGARARRISQGGRGFCVE